MKIYTQGRETLKLKPESPRIAIYELEEGSLKRRVDETQMLILCGGSKLGRIYGHLLNYFESFSIIRNKSSSSSTDDGDDNDFYDASYDYDK
jgi:hypothetical protein